MEDFNAKEIKIINIFDHEGFKEDIKNALKKFDAKEKFAEDIRKSLAYYFWAKCEYEVVISSFPAHITKEELERLNKEFKNNTEKYGHEPYCMWISPAVGKKVDIYEQVKLNWDIFVDYVWSHKRREK